MLETYKELISDTLSRSFPAYLFAALLAVLILAALFVRKRKALKFTGIYTVIAIAVFFFPPAALLFKALMYQGFTYWRYLWIIPYAAVGGAVLTVLVYFIKNKWLRILAILVICFGIMVVGNNVYLGKDKAYVQAYNPEKLPQEAVDAVNIINAHAEENGYTYKKAAVTHEFAPYIRQIDATIKLPFCRIHKQPQPTTAVWQRIYHVLAHHIGTETFIEDLEKGKCNYVMLRKNLGIEEVLIPAGYTEIGGTGEFLIFAAPYSEEYK